MKIARIDVRMFIELLQQVESDGVNFVDMVLTEQEDRDMIDLIPLEDGEDDITAINIITDEDITRLMLN